MNRAAGKEARYVAPRCVEFSIRSGPGIVEPTMKITASFSSVRALVSLAFVFANLGCSESPPGKPAPTGPEPLGDPLTYDVTKPGLYTCGHRVLQMTYTPPALPARTIPVEVWYPSTSTDGEHPKYQGVFEDLLAYNDVPLAPTSWKSGMPVLVHSHGYKGFAGNSGRLMCHFASHGWLAVAPAHVGNLINDTPDVLPLDIYIQRPHDIRAALDFIADLPADDELAGKADLGHVAMSGHSFGGYTAWAIAGSPLNIPEFETRCQMGDIADCTPEKMSVLAGDVSETRAKISIPLAGIGRSEIGDDHYDLAKKPVLMMSGTLDESGQNEIMALVKNVDLTWVNVEGGCHQLYGLGNAVLGDPECKVLPDEEGFSLVNPWILAYARYHVWDDRSQFVADLVERKVSISPKVMVEHFGP
jgi:predicted dienelactone hydrolase